MRTQQAVKNKIHIFLLNKMKKKAKKYLKKLQNTKNIYIRKQLQQDISNITTKHTDNQNPIWNTKDTFEYFAKKN